MCVFPHLLGSFEKLFVGGVVVVFAFVGRVRSTNSWSSFVGATEIVFLKMLAVGEDHHVPIAILIKDADSSMHHVPPHVIVVVP